MKSFALPSVYEALNLVMKYYPDNFNNKAKVEIETLFAHCLEGLSDDSEKFLSSLFIKSLKSHIGYTSTNDNIYLKKYEIPQIQLFDLLIKEFPFVRISQQIVNGAIINLMQGEEEVVLVDIGIGQGTQLSNLISLSGDLKTLKKLKIVGVEPFEQALMQAEKTINAHNQKTNFDIEFQGINDFIENIDLRKYIDTKGKVIVNASLALHHIQSSDLRFNALKMVKSINPAAFILVEPNVDHFEPNFYRRFQNCYQHFYAVFQVIDKLNLSKDDKNAFKLFYGREIDDIIGKHEENRFEKHEPAYRWIEKLKYSGFNLKTDFFSFPIETPHGLKIDFQSEGFLGFSYGNETVLSIIYAN